MKTSSRVLSTVALAAAASASTLAAARRHSLRQHRGPQLHVAPSDTQPQALQRQNNLKNEVLGAVAEYLGALARGEQPPPWPPNAGEPTTDEASAVLRRLLEQVRDREAGTRSAAVALARSWQTAAHRLQKVTDGMLDRHADEPDVIEDAFRIAHTAAVQAHRTQSLTLLCGAGLGQQWPHPMPLAEVIRSATGRITDYQRVNPPEAPNLAVAAHAAEAIIHLLAALLANAIQASPPSAPVHVDITAIDGGHAITVTDNGGGLSADRLRWANERASGRQQVGLAELGAPPQTGLAVIGYLARDYGLGVRLQQSVYGGVTAVVTVPEHLLVAVENTTPPPLPPRAPAEPEPTVPDTAPIRPAPATLSTTPGGLPRRTRGQSPLPPAPPADPPPPTAPARSPEDTGDFLSRLTQGAAAAAAGPATAAEHTDDASTNEE
jgi:C4-dicarboxylate-specific signal transduction histidine kinase